MRQYRETSRENWNNVKDTEHLRKTVNDVLSIFRDNGKLTTDEAHHYYRQKFGNLARNEFAKRVSYLSTVGRLKELGERVCSIKNKNLLFYEVSKDFVRNKNRKNHWQLRIDYLENLLTVNGIAFKNETPKQLLLF